MNTKIKLWQVFFLLSFTLLITVYFVSCNDTPKKYTLYDDWGSFSKKTIAKRNLSSAFDDLEVSKPSVTGSNCFGAFADTLTSHGFSLANKPMLTTSITFGRVGLRDWLENYKIFDNCDQIDIKLGIYTAAYIATLPEPFRTNYAKNVGRIGVFIWPARVDGRDPTFNGAPIPVFDLGGLQP